MSEKPGSTLQQTLYVPWHPEKGWDEGLCAHLELVAWRHLAAFWPREEHYIESAEPSERDLKNIVDLKADGWKIIKIELPDEPLKIDGVLQEKRFISEERMKGMTFSEEDKLVPVKFLKWEQGK